MISECGAYLRCTAIIYLKKKKKFIQPRNRKCEEHNQHHHECNGPNNEGHIIRGDWSKFCKLIKK